MSEHRWSEDPRTGLNECKLCPVRKGEHFWQSRKGGRWNDISTLPPCAGPVAPEEKP